MKLNKIRVNVILPSQTINLLDRVIKKGERSRIINEAIKSYLRKVSRIKLKEQLKEGALKRADRDLLLAEEWFSLENEL
ncbi:MAG: hypothetical protein HY934_00295 [Candidatus Firestonebacteria bacterium]|nr:hypothetical protein [Candidatus Firestonebacteria bacterium]